MQKENNKKLHHFKAFVIISWQPIQRLKFQYRSIQAGYFPKKFGPGEYKNPTI